MASPGGCCLWSCTQQLSPYCSENHRIDAINGEASEFGVPIDGQRDDDEIHRTSVKCLRARALVRATGVPELPVASLTTNPWLLDNTFFNRDLNPGQRVKNWVFFSVAAYPGPAMGRIWRRYDDSTVAVNIRKRRHHLDRRSRSTDGGLFKLAKFQLEGLAVAFYWLTFEASVAGQKGVYTPVVIAINEGKAERKNKNKSAPEGHVQSSNKKREGEAPSGNVATAPIVINSMRRCEIWTVTDKDRRGMLPFVVSDGSFGFEQYVEYALNVPMLSACGNKKHVDCTGMTFQGRYDILRNYMPKVVSIGLAMMLRTCTVQVDLDFSSESAKIRKFRAGFALHSVATAPRPPTEIWTVTDKDRRGMLPFVVSDGSFGFEQYVEYALNVPMFSACGNKKHVDCTGMTFQGRSVSFVRAGFALE